MPDQRMEDGSPSDTTETPELDDETADQVAEMMTRVYEGDATLGEYIGVEEESVAYIEQQAYQLYVNDQFEQAERLVRGLVALDETRFYPNKLLGDILFQQGPGVSDHATEIITDRDERGREKLSRYNEAIAAFERAISLEGEDDFVALRLAELYTKVGRSEEGTSLLEAVAAESDDPSIRDRAEVLLEVTASEAIE